MCMEDIRIGRDSKSTQRFVVCGLASTVLIDADSKRTTLVISPPQAGRITLSLAPIAIDLQGIVINSTNPALTLNIRDHGDIVTRRITSICDNAAQTIGILSASLAKE